MKRLAMIAVTCVLGFMLTACGEQSTPKPTADTTNTPASETTSHPASTDDTKSQ